MKKRRFVWLLVALVLPIGSARAEQPSAIPPGTDFGAGLTLERTTSLAEVVQEPERFAEKPILLHGRISDVCQRRGCWIVLQDADSHVRVHFKDYAFFLPTDSTGDEAFVEGLVTIRMLSEQDARHYESESQDGDPERVEGPRREVGFTASGVRLVRRD